MYVKDIFRRQFLCYQIMDCYLLYYPLGVIKSSIIVHVTDICGWYIYWRMLKDGNRNMNQCDNIDIYTGASV